MEQKQASWAGKHTKERLTQVAIKLFVQRGYFGTAIDNIVKEVGLTKGAFYTHYVSKAALLLSIVDRYKRCYLVEIIRISSQKTGDAMTTGMKFIHFRIFLRIG